MTAQTSSLKERQRQERERLIVQAAAEVLVEQGYDAMSMEEVANRVGVSRTAIYLHFPSKEDLVLTLIQRGIETSAERLDALLAQKTSPREKVCAIIERSYTQNAQPSFQVLSALMHSPSFATKAVEKGEEMDAMWKPTMARFSALLEEGKRSGDFDPEMPTPLMVHLLVTLLSPFTKHLFEQMQLPREVVAAQLSRYFVKGVGADQSACHPVKISEVDSSGREAEQEVALD